MLLSSRNILKCWPKRKIYIQHIGIEYNESITYKEDKKEILNLPYTNVSRHISMTSLPINNLEVKHYDTSPKDVSCIVYICQCLSICYQCTKII